MAALGIAAGFLPGGAWGAEPDAGDASVRERDVAPSTCGALHVEGTRLVDAAGQPVQLRGVSTHGLAWFPQYVNKECFCQLRDWGASVVRLAMYTAESGGWCTDGDRDQLRRLINTGVQAATAADLYAIIDWHILSDGNPNIYRDEAVAFFDEMSQAYADQPNVLYEICNEPNGATTWDDVKSYTEAVIPAIRANAPDSVVLVGTPNWSQFVDQAAADPIAGFDNLMYTLHFYAATHTDALRATLEAAVGDGLPVFVSEFGICDASGNGAIDEAQADAWVGLLDRLGVSYVMWSLSNKDESASMIKSACEKTADFADDDLAPAGTWIKGVLSGDGATGATGTQGATTADAPGADETQPGTGEKQAGGTSAVADDGTLSCVANLRSSWEADGKTCLLFDLTIQNGGSKACSDWSVDVPFTEEFELQDSWNGNFAVDGTALHVSNASYNGQIEAGQSVTDVGVIVAGGPGLAIG